MSRILGFAKLEHELQKIIFKPKQNKNVAINNVLPRCQILQRWVAVCRPKFTNFLELRVCRCNPLYFLVYFPDCLRRVWFRRYSPLSTEVVQKPKKCKSFWVPIFGRDDSKLLRQIVSAIYCPPFGKVWLSSVCWSPSAKPGNKVGCRIYGGWVKCRSNFKLFVDQSS